MSSSQPHTEHTGTYMFSAVSGISLPSTDLSVFSSLEAPLIPPSSPPDSRGSVICELRALLRHWVSVSHRGQTLFPPAPVWACSSSSTRFQFASSSYLPIFYFSFPPLAYLPNTPSSPHHSTHTHKQKISFFYCSPFLLISFISHILYNSRAR